MLVFPLGLAYFIFLVTGFSIGLGTSVLLFGLLIIGLMFACSWGLSAFERQMAIWLLRVKIEPMSKPSPPGLGFWKRFTAYLTNPVTWLGLAYLLLKLPIGVVVFSVYLALLISSAAFLFAPLSMGWLKFDLGFWVLDSFPEYLVASFLGIFITLTSFHILNGLAYLLGQMSAFMLGGRKLKPGSQDANS